MGTLSLGAAQVSAGLAHELGRAIVRAEYLVIPCKSPLTSTFGPGCFDPSDVRPGNIVETGTKT